MAFELQMREFSRQFKFVMSRLIKPKGLDPTDVPLLEEGQSCLIPLFTSGCQSVWLFCFGKTWLSWCSGLLKEVKGSCY